MVGGPLKLTSLTLVELTLKKIILCKPNKAIYVKTFILNEYNQYVINLYKEEMLCL